MSRTGIRERRIVASRTQATSDLAIPAALRRSSTAGADPARVDLVIVATASPDMLFPATASIVAAAIGAARRCRVRPLRRAAPGSSTALAQAYARSRRACAGVRWWSAPRCSRGSRTGTTASTCILFGDGAGRGRRRAGRRRAASSASSSAATGPRRGHLIVPAGGSRLPASAETIVQGLHAIHMNGPEVFRFSTARIPGVGRAPARALRARDRGRRSVRAAPVEPAHHRPHRSRARARSRAGAR